MMTSIQQRINNIILENGYSDADFSFDSNLRTDLGFDSLDMLTLAMELEKEFWITIPDEEFDKVVTVGDIYKVVASHV